MDQRSVWPSWPSFHQGQGSDWDAALCGEIKPRHHGNIMCEQDDQGHMGERWLLYYIAHWLLSNGRRKVYLCQLFSCLSQLLINARIEVKHHECVYVCVLCVCVCVCLFMLALPGINLCCPTAPCLWVSRPGVEAFWATSPWGSVGRWMSELSEHARGPEKPDRGWPSLIQGGWHTAQSEAQRGSSGRPPVTGEKGKVLQCMFAWRIFVKFLVKF